MHITSREFSSRLIGRLLLFVWIAFLAGATGAKADPVKTLIQDTLYRADGSVAHGTVTIRWNDFSTAAGDAVAAGVLTVSTDANGGLAFPLIPNTGSSPSGSYYRVVIKTDDGITSEEQWVVPAVATTTIAAIRAKVVPQAVAAQFVSRDYVDSALAALSANQGTSPTVAYGGACPKGATAGSVCYTALPISVLAYGAKCDGATDDTAAIQAAFNAAVPNGVVTFPPSKSCYVATGTGTITLPGDDGTFPAGATCGGGACSTLAAEPVSTMPYAINVPGGIEIQGNNATIVGNFTAMTSLPTLSSLFVFQMNGSANNIHDLNFLNVFSPIFSNGLFVSEVKNVSVLNCGFVALTQKQDRARWKDITAQNCAAGIINGGWWTTRSNGTNEGGGYTDKSKYEDISFIQNVGMYYNAWARAYDTFFDTYFWKSVHNSDGRLTDAANPNYNVTSVSYKGVYGIALAHYARGIRPSVGNVIDLMMHYGSPRYAFLGQEEQNIAIRSIDVEQVGWGDGAQGNCPFGVTTACASTHLGVTFPVGIVNPYVSGKLDGVIYLAGSSGTVENLNNDAGGSISAATDIGGGSALAATSINAGNVDSSYNTTWLPSNSIVSTFPNGTGTLSIARGGLQGLYGLKYYDNAAGGDAGTKVCVDANGLDEMCVGKMGPIAVSNNFQMASGVNGYKWVQGFSGAFACNAGQGTASVVNTSGNTVSWVSGAHFSSALIGQAIGIGGVDYNVMAYTPGSSSPVGDTLTVNLSAGTQSAVTASEFSICRMNGGRGYDLGFGWTYYDDAGNGDNGTHVSLTSGTTPLNSTPQEMVSLFENGAVSIGMNGAHPASGYGLEIGSGTKFDVSPVAPTPATGDNSTKLATTAYVQAQGFLTSTSGCTASGPFPCVIWSGTVLNNATSGNRSAANYSPSITPPANGQYRTSISQLMVTPGSGTGTIQMQTFCTAPGGTTNGLNVSVSPFSGPTVAAGTESNSVGVSYCSTAQPFQWLLSSGNGSAAVSAFVTIERLQ